MLTFVTDIERKGMKTKCKVNQLCVRGCIQVPKRLVCKIIHVRQWTLLCVV
jgi:hypothetical protein